MLCREQDLTVSTIIPLRITPIVLGSFPKGHSLVFLVLPFSWFYQGFSHESTGCTASDSGRFHSGSGAHLAPWPQQPTLLRRLLSHYCSGLRATPFPPENSSVPAGTSNRFWGSWGTQFYLLRFLHCMHARHPPRYTTTPQYQRPGVVFIDCGIAEDGRVRSIPLRERFPGSGLPSISSAELSCLHC